MTAYVIANVRTAEPNEGMAEYRRRVQGTLDPFGGRFVVKGGKVRVEEGDWHPVHLSVIEFPDGDLLRGWLDSPAYREILPLRTDNVDTDLVIVESS
ncbi:DUF1330 domain-containing protein [Kitasatospora sp. NPDC018619]|uniref:DUF1330 domain-containing protein n=1 Tax=unclassified Kitasatospora TaxID=2633591 RepID=UPI0037AA145A